MRARKEGETFEEYKAARAEQNKLDKKQKKGRMVWHGAMGTYRKPKGASDVK